VNSKARSPAHLANPGGRPRGKVLPVELPVRMTYVLSTAVKERAKAVGVEPTEFIRLLLVRELGLLESAAEPVGRKNGHSKTQA
jgi:hypothetical protein